MSELYAKLAQRIIYSSIWEEDGDTCKVWVTLLALKDQNGVVDKNITGVARIAKLPIEKVEQAIQMFLEPDARSSSQEHEGRRIKVVPEGWLVLNHQKYQEYGWSDDKKARERIRKAAYRASQSPPQPEPPEAQKPKPTRSTFNKPTTEELSLHIAKIGLPPEEADKFMNHYESNGWKVGPNKMSSWKSAAANWKIRWEEKRKPSLQLPLQNQI